MGSGTCRMLYLSTNVYVPFLIHAVISWCGFIAHNLNRRTKPFSFLFCAVGKKIKK